MGQNVNKMYILGVFWGPCPAEIFPWWPWKTMENHGKTTVFHGKPSFSMKIHGIFIWKPWFSMENFHGLRGPWKTMVFHGLVMWRPCFSMVYHGFPWFSMVLFCMVLGDHEKPWFSIENHGFPWSGYVKSMENHGFPWYCFLGSERTIENHGFPWFGFVKMVFHGTACLSEFCLPSS